LAANELCIQNPKNVSGGSPNPLAGFEGPLQGKREGKREGREGKTKAMNERDGSKEHPKINF